MFLLLFGDTVVLHDLSMHKPHFTQEQLAQVAKLSDKGIVPILTYTHAKELAHH